MCIRDSSTAIQGAAYGQGKWIITGNPTFIGNPFANTSDVVSGIWSSYPIQTTISEGEYIVYHSSLDRWVTVSYTHLDVYKRQCLDAGWVDCKCSICGGCICSKYDHMCVKLSICRCRNRPPITILNFKNGAQYNCDPYSSSDDDNNENNYGTNDYNSRPSQKYSYGDDEILNSCWGCYRKTCLDCNPPPINSDDECGDPCCRECYGDGYRWGY